MKRVAILSAVRTPIGKFGGALSKYTAVELGQKAVSEAVTRSGLRPQDVGQTIIGLARQASCGPNPARQISIRAGIPETTPAWTLNQACASGLAAISFGAQQIQLGTAEVVVAGGAESMSNVPYLLEKVRFGPKLGHQRLTDAMYQDGLFCPLADMIMGETAEILVDELNISRQEQDEFATHSQNKCEEARRQGKFADEIVAVEVKDGPMTSDEHPRDGVTVEKLAKLKTVFRKDGTITAGNASGITDGASALVLTSEEKVKQLGLEPLAWYEGGLTVGLDPKRMGLGPARVLEQYLGAGLQASRGVRPDRAQRSLRGPGDRL